VIVSVVYFRDDNLERAKWVDLHKKCGPGWDVEPVGPQWPAPYRPAARTG